ncbi:hypothetical protein DFH08DRAFT_889999 [Mycena albidolilacea]|uniref:Uncharacterized protein n=1 Tax=Mycena albidolilacea TaxID=1033008 RepID=A0AAD6ZGL0_9AGAR|nr:hypothetical protein DFH08DRAFT_889999 [Mycena albidolilacea]
MPIHSLYPPLPPVPDANVVHTMFGRPDQAEWPDYTIHVEEKTGRKRTYKHFLKQVELGATALGAKLSHGGLGLNGDGDEMIGLMGDNSLEYIDIILSLLMVTTPFALISAYSTRFELVHALKVTKVTRVFVDAKLLDNVLAAIEDPDVHITPDKIYILSGQPVNGRKSFGQIVDLVMRNKVPLEPVRPAKKDTLAYLLMSSGTSGLPKAVMITHGNDTFSHYQLTVINQLAVPFLGPRATMQIIVGVLPMFHTYGLHAYVLRATLAPATYVILEKWNTVQYLKTITKYRATTLTLIPSAIHQLVNHPDIKTTDLSSVNIIISGAAYLPPELAAQMKSFLNEKSVVEQMYGLSESTLVPFTRPTEGMLNMPANTTGILVPGLTARIVREDGTDAATGEAGELWLRGDNIVRGYWNNSQANANTFVDGWLRTGDRFSADAKGYFFFADRAKDTLKVSGTQVSPMEIEDVLFAHPEKLISDVSVAGVSGGRTDDEKVPRAWIVLSSSGQKKGPAAVITALEQWHRESLSKYKWLRGGIEVVKEIPKTPTGKIMRRVLQEEYERRAKKSWAKL